MKKTFIIFILFCLTFITSAAFAQLGWQWGKTATNYGAGLTAVEGHWIASDRAGGAYVAATMVNCDSIRFGSFTLRDSINTIEPLLLARVDASGNYLWAKTSRNTQTWIMGIASDKIGDLYVLGNYNFGTLNLDGIALTNPGFQTICYLIKISQGGTVLWAKNISNAGTYGGYGSMYVDDNGNAYVTGNYTGNATIGTTALPNTDDIFVAKFNAAGNFVWAKSYGSKGSDVAVSVTPAQAGYFYFAADVPKDSSITIGATTLNGPRTSFYAKCDTNGNVVWAKNLPATFYLQAATSDVVGDLYMTGWYSGTMTLGSSTITSVGGVDFVVTKSNGAGNLLWGNGAGGSLNDAGYSLTTDVCGKLWVSGSMGGSPVSAGYSMDFNGHPLALSTACPDPIFVAEYDTAGNYFSSMALASGGDDFNQTTGVLADNGGNLFVCSDYTQAQMIFAHDTLDTIAGHHGEYFFIAKYKYDTTLCPAEIALSVEPAPVAMDGLTLFPNPATTSLTIAAGDKINTVVISNLLGQTVYYHQYNETTVTIDVSNLPPAVYLVRVNETEVRKFVKQ